MQTTNKVFMVKPVNFGFNPQTATDNAFQKRGYEEYSQENALREFISYISLLKANKIEVIVAEDTPVPHTPDSIFPNNWFTTHSDGTLVIYPMSAPNRRNERKKCFIDTILKNFDVKRVVDFSWWESEDKFLEGTGSLILDRNNKIAYAGISPRTSETVLEDFCKKMGYTPITFHSYDRNGVLIYHTNVMMSLGEEYAVICLESITDEQERNRVYDSLVRTGKKIVPITHTQVENFAGNMIGLKGGDGKDILVMSASARKSLTPQQATELGKMNRILSPQLDFIEMNGGGSARCMIAEIF